MMELIWLKIRHLDLQQRQPTGNTELWTGMSWMLEQAQLLTDLADHLLRRASNEDQS